MANLKEIRSRIKSVKNIQKVTKAMKMVAAAKLRKSQENMEKARPYEKRLKKLIGYLADDAESQSIKLLQAKDTIETLGLVIVTADRGLAASFNTNIIKKAEKEIANVGKQNAKLFCIGKKGYEHFFKRDYELINHYKDFWMNLNYNQAIDIGNDIVSAYVNKEIDSVKVIYNYFKNVGSQEVIFEKLLPLSFDNDKQDHIQNIIFEPSKTEVVKSLVPKYFNTQIWQFLLESFASEQAARMMAMENATENAKDMINELNLEFNKARQSAITTEMLEIVGGAEALSN